MKVLVLLKKTPDTESKIKLSSDGSSIDTGGVKFVINPYDEYAVEQALLIKKAAGDCEVVITSFGDDSSKETIVKGLAMGADRGLLIDNSGLDASDCMTTAKVLAGAIKSESPDIVFCGMQASDDDAMQIPAMVGGLLDWPHVNVVTKCDVDGDKATVEREVEGGQVEVYEVGLPAVFGAHKALNTPRYASLPGIMKAKKKPFDKKSPSELGADAGDAKTLIKKFSYPPEKPPGKLFQGEDVAVMVDKVVKALREEAQVI